MKSRELLLQPVSAGDLIDRSLRLYRRHLTSLLAIAAVPGLVAVLGGLLTVFAGGDLLTPAGGHLLIYGLSPILNLMVVGGLTKVVANHVMFDEPITFRRTWQVVIQHFGRLFGVAVIGWLLLPVTVTCLIGVGVIGLGMITILLTPLPAGPGASWLMALPIAIMAVGLSVLGGLAFLEIYARVAMMPAAAVIERQPVGSAVARGLKLGAKNSPIILALFSFEYCLIWSIATALGVPLGIVAMIEGVSLGPNATDVLAMSANILLQIGSLIAAPVVVIALALLYFDNRVCKEGLDVEVMAQEIAFPAGSAPAPVPHPVGYLHS
jgi:hypothetical protein